MTAGNRFVAAAFAAIVWTAWGIGFDESALRAQPPEGFDRAALIQAADVARVDGRFERLDGYLRFMAKRLDFYFTIEEGPPSYYPSDIAERPGKSLPVDVASIDDLVMRLSETFDDVRVFRNEAMPNVVHLVSKKLAIEDKAKGEGATADDAEKVYVLDRRVNAQYRGRLNLLPSYLGRAAGGGMTAWSVGVPPDYQAGDHETKVAISATDRTVRDVLTAAVPGVARKAVVSLSVEALPPDENEPDASAPPAVYDRLLWIAQTRAADSPLVQVRYSGPELSAEDRSILAGETGWDFEAYLRILAKKLDFHFTVEDGTPPGEDSHVLSHIEKIAIPGDLDSIDGFVDWSNANVEGVAFFRNEKVPRVVHVVAKHLLTDDSVMNRKVTIRKFSGHLSGIVGAVSEQVGDQIQSSTGGGFPGGDFGDHSTHTTLDVENETVRNALTVAAPLEARRRYLWEAISGEGTPTVVKFRSPNWSDEEYVLSEYGLNAYLKEMGCRLDCYFTFEDQGDGYENWRRDFHHSQARYDLDFDIRSIDDLVASLDDVLNRRYVYDEARDREFAKRWLRVRVVRSEKHPRVIHLIEKGRPDDRYVLDKRIDFGFHGKLDELPNALKAIDSRLAADKGRLPISTNNQPIDDEYGDELPNVKVGAADVTVREALTEASLLDGHRRILWRATSVGLFGQPETRIRYFGTFDNVAEALGYDENPAPKPPVDGGGAGQDPFGPPPVDPFK